MHRGNVQNMCSADSLYISLKQRPKDRTMVEPQCLEGQRDSERAHGED